MKSGMHAVPDKPTLPLEKQVSKLPVRLTFEDEKGHPS